MWEFANKNPDYVLGIAITFGLTLVLVVVTIAVNVVEVMRILADRIPDPCGNDDEDESEGVA